MTAAEKKILRDSEKVMVAVVIGIHGKSSFIFDKKKLRRSGLTKCGVGSTELLDWKLTCNKNKNIIIYGCENNEVSYVRYGKFKIWR